MTPPCIEDLPVVKLELFCHKPAVADARARLDAIAGRRWAVLDFETASEDHPMVIEVGLVDMDGNVLLECQVNPGIPITPFVTDIHEPDIQGPMREVLLTPEADDDWPPPRRRRRRRRRPAPLADFGEDDPTEEVEPD